MELLIQEWGSKAALFFLLLSAPPFDSCVPDFPCPFIAVKPGLQPVLLEGVDGEAPSPSSAFPGAEFLFALIPHSLLCLFVQIKRSVNNPGSYLFMAVLFVINWAGKGWGCPESHLWSSHGFYFVFSGMAVLGKAREEDGSAGEMFPWMFVNKEPFNSTMEAHPTKVVQFPAAQLWIKTQPKQCKGFQTNKIMNCWCKKLWNGVKSIKKST